MNTNGWRPAHSPRRHRWQRHTSIAIAAPPSRLERFADKGEIRQDGPEVGAQGRLHDRLWRRHRSGACRRCASGQSTGPLPVPVPPARARRGSPPRLRSDSTHQVATRARPPRSVASSRAAPRLVRAKAAHHSPAARGEGCRERRGEAGVRSVLVGFLGGERAEPAIRRPKLPAGVREKLGLDADKCTAEWKWRLDATNAFGSHTY